MEQSPFLFLKDFGSVKLIMDKSGQAWLFWTLTEKQQKFLGLEISPFLCFLKYDLCDKHLQRPHLTCLTCKVRLVVSGKLPLQYPIHIFQVWSREGKSKLRKFLFKNALSLSEMLS